MEGMRPGWALKAIVVIIITSVFFRCVCASSHTVGGFTGWDLRSNLLVWSSTTTFHVGDDLVFTYMPIHDVVEVNQLGYDMCMISNAIAAYDSGDTVIHLTEPGIRYFVCGRSGHCQQGLKLLVQVLALPNNGSDGTQRRGRSGNRSPPRSPPSSSPPPLRQSPPPPPPLRQSPPPPPPPPAPINRPSPPSPSPPPSPPSPEEPPSPPSPEEPPSPPSPEEPPSPADDHVPDSPHSGAIDIIADTAFLCHVLVPLITLVVLSYTHARLFFNFWRFLVLI